ncbi:MAG: aldo/keto reductase [Gemmatimonadaceae bacterium]
MKPTISVPGRTTLASPLGVGLATLMREPSRSRQLALLEAAYEAGYRHFDVAPSYGLGTAESVVGAFLRRRHDGISVGTKVGIRARGNAGLMRSLQRPARALLRRFPALRGRATQAVGSAVHVPPDFSIPFCDRSLDASLRALGVEHLDILLLHEPTPAALADGQAVDWIQEQRRRGRVRATGIASSAAAAAAILAAHPRAFDVAQMPSSVLAPTVASLGELTPALVVTHGVIATPLARAKMQLARNPAWGEALTRIAGVDAGANGMLTKILLACALHENPNGIVLVGSSSEPHLRAAPEAVGAFEPSHLDAAGDFLRETLSE